MRPAVTQSGDEYCEYLLTYVDDCLVITKDPKAIIDRLKEPPHSYTLKDFGPPKRYLGAEIGRNTLNTGQTWYMSAELYLTKAIEEIERKQGPLFRLYSKSTLDAPTRSHFHPELDDLMHLDEDDIALYQSYVGILRWAVELGRIDVCHVAGVLARFSTAPREGHLVAILRVFAYCKRHISLKLVIDHMKKDFIETSWPVHNWEQFYPDAPKIQSRPTCHHPEVGASK